MYSEKVMDHFQNPRNVGEIENASGVGTVGNAKCGDIMRIYLDIDENKIIRDCKFKTFGCGAAVATSSMATELVKGKTIEEALKVTNKAVMEALDGLPPVKVHCSLLAEEAIHAALWDYAEKNGIDPANIFVVSIMPCTAKKGEKEREALVTGGLKDVDAVLTTRELGDLIKRSGINFTALPDEEFDSDLLGDYSGAGVIFGVTGGVMEAALRTAYYVLTGKEHDLIKFEAVRGFDGIKEASLEIGGQTINVAVASGMKNAKILMDEVRAGTSKYAFIEIMGCPGGCIAGGGQPYVKPCFLPDEDVDILDTYKEKRAAALYSEDERQTVRQSHNNPQIQQLYADYLGEPNSHKAHELLHTTYSAKVRFN